MFTPLLFRFAYAQRHTNNCRKEILPPASGNHRGVSGKPGEINGSFTRIAGEPAVVSARLNLFTGEPSGILFLAGGITGEASVVIVWSVFGAFFECGANISVVCSSERQLPEYPKETLLLPANSQVLFYIRLGQLRFFVIEIALSACECKLNNKRNAGVSFCF
ncbi:MAG TPA: hypothetical protein VMR70_15910 [Flavisolibacter sp.]|nr:hypothetical protein [Flavisolibacter sp.]